MTRTLFYKIENYIPFMKPYEYHTEIIAFGFTFLDRTKQECKCLSTILHIEERNLQLKCPMDFRCVTCCAWDYEKKKVYHWYRPITIYDEED